MGINTMHMTELSIHDWIKNFLNLFKKKREKEGRAIRGDFVSTLGNLASQK